MKGCRVIPFGTSLGVRTLCSRIAASLVHLQAKPMDSDTKDAVETLHITEGLNPNQIDCFRTVITS